MAYFISKSLFSETTSRVDNKLIQEPKEHVSSSDSMVIDEVIKKLSQGTFVVKKKLKNQVNSKKKKLSFRWFIEIWQSAGKYMPRVDQLVQ